MTEKFDAQAIYEHLDFLFIYYQIEAEKNTEKQAELNRENLKRNREAIIKVAVYEAEIERDGVWCSNCKPEDPNDCDNCGDSLCYPIWKPLLSIKDFK